MQKKLVYLLAEFPEHTQTFVRDEINEMIKNNVHVTVVAQRCGKDYKISDDHSAWTKADIAYLTGYVARHTVLGYIIKNLFCNPLRLLSTFILFKRYYSPTLSYGFSYVLHAAHIMEKYQPDHIHVHFAFRAAELAVFVSKLTGIPFSVTAHANDIFTNPVNIDFKFSYAQFIVAISKFGRDYICNTLTSDNPKICDKVNIIHCGIDPEIVNKNTGAVSNDKISILSVGRLVEKKGMEFLIKACHTLVEKGIKDFKCVIIGDGPLLADLLTLRDELMLHDYVDLAGTKSHDEIINILTSTDIFVLPCIKTKDNDMDGIPVSLMEAMAMSVPVISTPISGISELIHGGGHLCNTEDVDDLTDKIESLYNMSANERGHLGEKGKNIILSDFNRKKEVAKLSNLIFETPQL